MRISCVSFDAYPVLNPIAKAGIGGAEVRAVTFAKRLQAKSNCLVNFVVRSQPGLPNEVGGFPLFQYVKPKPNPLAKLSQSIAKRLTNRPSRNTFFYDLDTDIVLCFGVRNDTASIVRSVRESGNKLVLFLTSDRNIEDARRQNKSDRGVYGELGHLCRYAIQHANHVVVQTEHQQNALKEHLGIQGSLIRNPIDVNLRNFDTVPNTEKSKILWVGRADTYSKRADLCIELAHRRPNYDFQMIMNNHDAATFKQLKQNAPSNVEIIEQVAYSKIERYFSSCKILINTSAAEGFPNSFLQAAKYGKPVVSLDVNPGETLTTHGCGVCAQGDLDRMASEMDTLMYDAQQYTETSQRIRQYVCEYHDAEQRCNELHSLLCKLSTDHTSIAA